jgi:hypothetical protein
MRSGCRLVLVLLLSAPAWAHPVGHHGHPKALPAKSYERAPVKPPNLDDCCRARRAT